MKKKREKRTIIKYLLQRGRKTHDIKKKSEKLNIIKEALKKRKKERKNIF